MSDSSNLLEKYLEKLMFVRTVVSGLQSAPYALAQDSSNYGYGGEWVESSSDLDTEELYVIALHVWYERTGFCAPPEPVLYLEAQELRLDTTPTTRRVKDDSSVSASTIGEVYYRLDRAYTRASSTTPREWDNSQRRLRGQSLVTALTVQGELGGEVVVVPTESGLHYSNVLPDGQLLDLCREFSLSRVPFLSRMGEAQVVSAENLLADPANVALLAALDHEGTYRF